MIQRYRGRSINVHTKSHAIDEDWNAQLRRRAWHAVAGQIGGGANFAISGWDRGMCQQRRRTRVVFKGDLQCAAGVLTISQIVHVAKRRRELDRERKQRPTGPEPSPFSNQPQANDLPRCRVLQKAKARRSVNGLVRQDDHPKR